MAKLNSKKQILLVDHEKPTREMLSTFLETHGYKVVAALTGQDALNNVSGAVDLILLNLFLPDQDGFQVCHKLKENERTRRIPIIMLSSRVLTEDVVEGLYLGADDYLTKPFECEELIARMEAVLRRNSFYHESQDLSNEEKETIRQIRKIINEERITPYFQPIFLLKPFELLGLEVLSRSDVQGELANPEVLFKTAFKFGFYQDLEILAWRKALEYLSKHLTSDEKIFLNCNPYLIESSRFLTIHDLLKKNKISVKNVFLEVTERSAVSDLNFYFEHLRMYREYGFKFAVDDVGGGHTSLETIIEIKPEVIKIDQRIISYLEKDEFKRSIVKFVVSFCKENNIICIAEGIETKSILEIVKGMGIDAAQGYYLYKPTPKLNLQEIKGLKV